MTQQVDPINLLPKVDIHRHLEGSLRLSSLAEIAKVEALHLPDDMEALRPHVQIAGEKSVSTQDFLAKFKNIRHFFRSREIIQRFVREAIEDAAQDHVRVLELRFTPAALAQAADFKLEQVTDWVLESVRSATEDYGVTVACALSVNRHEPTAIAENVIDMAIDRIESGIMGVDLAGDEARYSAAPFKPALQRAKNAGLGITVHAGEWAGAENVQEAIEALEADRIGHGIHVLEDKAITATAAKSGAIFEVSLTSNWKTGAIPDLKAHPVTEMIQAGLAVALSTDDPSIFETSMSAECRIAQEHFDFSLDSIKGFNLTALQAMFLPGREKKNIEKELVQAYWGPEAKVASHR